MRQNLGSGLCLTQCRAIGRPRLGGGYGIGVWTGGGVGGGVGVGRWVGGWVGGGRWGRGGMDRGGG